jgi:tetratricopeptide (TPR) repeat protein
MSASSCHHHPDVPATTRCEGCEHPLCTGCAVFEGGVDLCPSCLAHYVRSRKIRKGMLIGSMVAGLAASVLYLVGAGALRPEERPGALPRSDFDYGVMAQQVTMLRQQLEKDPCDRSKGVAYVQALFTAQDWRGTLLNAEDFIARCGPFPQLRSVTYSAHMHLSEFDLALRDATELIESAPDNAGYWVWRGLAHEASQAFDKALADFEEAFRLQPAQFQVANHLSSAYERQKQPCEAYFVLLDHLRVNPGLAGQPKFEKRLLTLLDKGPCMEMQNRRWQEP